MEDEEVDGCGQGHDSLELQVVGKESCSSLPMNSGKET